MLFLWNLDRNIKILYYSCIPLVPYTNFVFHKIKKNKKLFSISINHSVIHFLWDKTWCNDKIASLWRLVTKEFKSWKQPLYMREQYTNTIYIYPPHSSNPTWYLVHSTALMIKVYDLSRHIISPLENAKNKTTFYTDFVSTEIIQNHTQEKPNVSWLNICLQNITRTPSFVPLLV